MLSRKQVRDLTYKLIFQYLFSKEERSKQYEITACADMSPEDADYLDRVYFGVIEHYDELTEEIGKYAKNFVVERIATADLAALLLAIYEMHYEKDVPLNVSIAEAVELVKTYSTEKSHQFVNGILSSVYKEITKA